METVIYQGIQYRRLDKHWVDERYLAVSEELQDILNKAYLETLNLDLLDSRELIQRGDQCKATGSVFLAIQLYEKAIQRGTTADARGVLPRLTSCYRKQGFPKKAIDCAVELRHRFGPDILSPVTLTSLAAAYCDLGEWALARKCADRAYASGAKGAGELRAVYERIRLHTEGKQRS